MNTGGISAMRAMRGSRSVRSLSALKNGVALSSASDCETSRHVVAAQVGVHAPGGLLALGDRLDDGLRAEHDVAAGEHARVVGLEGPVVDLDGAPLGALDALLLAGAVELGELADGGDDLVALDDELGALDGHRAAAAGGVGLAELHALHLDAGDLVVGVGDDAHAGRTAARA